MSDRYTVHTKDNKVTLLKNSEQVDILDVAALLNKQSAEIERLKVEMGPLYPEIEELNAQCNKYDSEIERLKTENWHLKHQIYLLVKEQGE